MPKTQKTFFLQMSEARVRQAARFRVVSHRQRHSKQTLALAFRIMRQADTAMTWRRGTTDSLVKSDLRSVPEPPATTTPVVGPVPSVTATSPSSGCTIGAIDCIGGQFAQCVDGTYVLTSCAPGTTCTKIPISDTEFVVTCDYISPPSLLRRDLKRHRRGHKHGFA
jgi:hypothetical protein